MGGLNRDGARGSGEQPPAEPAAWWVERDDLWAWVAQVLDGVAAPNLNAATLRALCGQALDTHAPAALVRAQAAGVALEYLAAARILQAYTDRYGSAAGRYESARLRAVLRYLRRRDAPRVCEKSGRALLGDKEAQGLGGAGA